MNEQNYREAYKWGISMSLWQPKPAPSIEQIKELLGTVQVLKLEAKVIKASPPPSISLFTNLRQLILCKEYAHVLQNLAAFSKLECLVLSNEAYFDKIPANIHQLKTLKYLKLRGTFSQIPECIGDLNNLQELIIESHHLQSLPTTIGRLSKLSKLMVISRELKEIPVELDLCTKLTKLILDVPQATVIPELPQLNSLQHFHLRSEAFFPKSLGTLTQLTTLSLEICMPMQKNNNEFLQYLEHIRHLTQLKKLVLKSGYLHDQLPDWLGEFEQLEFLEFENLNPTVSLSFLKKLKKIKVLNLPHVIVNHDFLKTTLPQLESLHIGDSLFSGEEVDLRGKDKLKYIYFETVLDLPAYYYGTEHFLPIQCKTIIYKY